MKKYVYGESIEVHRILRFSATSKQTIRLTPRACEILLNELRHLTQENRELAARLTEGYAKTD